MKLSVLLLSAFISIAALALPSPYDQAHVGSGHKGAYADAVAEITSVAAEFPEWITLEKIGQTATGQDLFAVRIQKPQLVCGKRPAVIITGGMHGDEIMGWEWKLPRFFVESRETLIGVKRWLRNLGVIYIVPILNPDGLAATKRANSRDVDLASNFDLLPENEAHMTEAETKAVVAYLSGDIAKLTLKPQLYVDLHCCSDSLTYPWGYTLTSLPADRIDRHKMFADAFQKGLGRTLKAGTTSDVHGYNVRGSAGDFFFSRYGAMAFELGLTKADATHFESQARMWDEVLNLAIDEVELDL